MLLTNDEAFSPMACASLCHGTCYAECYIGPESSAWYYAPAYQIGLAH